ncbi:MAG: cation:proton antiporter subunit C [Emergencia sp.]|nr:cation:proton antiporter subunit C [Emergencia sp.]
MTELNAFLAEHGIFMLTIILFFLGIFGMISCGNYMKKLMCMNVMQIAVIFFFLCLGQKTGGTIPVSVENLAEAKDYINPLPHALMLTAIVVSLGTTGVGLALLMRIKDKYGTLEEEEIIKKEAEE